jgi:hypothetical protein
MLNALQLLLSGISTLYVAMTFFIMEGTFITRVERINKWSGEVLHH